MKPAVPLGGLLMVAIAASLWGTWALFVRPTGLPATVTSLLVLGFIAVWSLPLAWRDPPARWDRTTLWLLAGNTCFDAINLVTFFGAIERTSVAIAVLTHYLAPILIALAAPRVDGIITRGAAAAALLATAGLVLVLQPWQAAADGVVVGGALGAISAVAYAANVFTVRRLAPRIGASRLISYHSFLAALLILPLAAGDLHAIDRTDLLRLGGASLVLGALAGIAFVRGLTQIGAARAAVLTYLEPLVAVITGWIAFGEALGGWAAVGGGLVLASGVWVARAPTYQRSPPDR